MVAWTFNGFSFQPFGDEVAVSPVEESTDGLPQVLVPMTAFHAIVLAKGKEAGPASPIAGMLLGDQLERFASAVPHPSARLSGKHVVVTGRAWDGESDRGSGPETTYRVPLSAARRFTFLMFEQALWSTTRRMAPARVEALALALLRPASTA